MLLNSVMDLLALCRLTVFKLASTRCDIQHIVLMEKLQLTPTAVFKDIQLGLPFFPCVKVQGRV